MVGYFDPLHAAHVRRLSELRRNGETLVAVVADPPAPVLPLRARAELVAGLSAVDYVLPAGADALGVAERLGRGEIIDETGSDEQRRDELIRQVKRRQNAV
ncbi:MAG: adenylyltransferase/cytidyltransferase family protein [Acidobacteria bacterium]|nr:adenylyltransferase/cytidyltransferase family protein [Acidobacteriota bacterium]